MSLSRNLESSLQFLESPLGHSSDFLPVLLQAGQGDPFAMLFPVAAIMLIFYLLIIRTQNKKQKEHEAMKKSIIKGDRVVTEGGLHGEVVGDTEEILTLEIANIKGERVRVKIDRNRILRRPESAERPLEGTGQESSV